jgi:hypothetical protein
VAHPAQVRVGELVEDGCGGPVVDGDRLLVEGLILSVLLLPEAARPGAQDDGAPEAEEGAG